MALLASHHTQISISLACSQTDHKDGIPEWAQSVFRSQSQLIFLALLFQLHSFDASPLITLKFWQHE